MDDRTIEALASGEPDPMARRVPDCTTFHDAFDALEMLHRMDSAKALRLACAHFGISEAEGTRLLVEADALDNGNS